MLSKKLGAALCLAAICNFWGARSQAQPAATPTPATTEAASSLSSGDKSWIEKSARAGIAEVSLGRLAAQKASKDDVKQVAQRMVDDHSKANDELTALAKAKGFTPPPDMDEKHKDLLAKLEKLSGAEFDKEYLKSQVKDHNDAIAHFESGVKKLDGADLKNFAAKTLPVLREHGAHVEAVAKANGVDAKVKGAAPVDAKTGATSHAHDASTKM